MSSCVQLQKSLSKLLNLSSEFTSVFSCLDESNGHRDPENKQAIESAESLLQDIQLAIGELESYLHVSLRQAQEIMEREGYEGFLGPETIKKGFDMELSPDQIPPIAFTKEQLERAKKLGQMLVLRINHVKDKEGSSQSLDVTKIVEISSGHGIKLRDKDDFLATDQGIQETGAMSIKDQTHQSEWVLVTKEILSETRNNNYLGQTEILIDYLENKFFKGQYLPQRYQEAIQEFEQVKRDYFDLAELSASKEESEWQKASKILSELKITRLLRRSPLEILYDLYLYKTQYDKYLLAGKTSYDWSSGRRSHGGLAVLGDFDTKGVDAFGGDRPDGSTIDLGASVSCRSFSEIRPGRTEIVNK